MEFVDKCAKCGQDGKSAESLYGIFTSSASRSGDLVSYISQRAIPSSLIFKGDFFQLPITDAVVLKEIWSSGLRFNCLICERSIGHQDYEYSNIFEKTISSSEINQEIFQLIATTIIESIEETIDSIRQGEWFVVPLLAQVLDSDQFSDFLFNSLLPNETRIKLRAALTSLSEFEQDFADAEADSGSGDAGNAVFQNAATYLAESPAEDKTESKSDIEAVQDVDASDPSISHDAQRIFVQSDDNFERASLAGNTGALPEILNELSTDKDDMVRSAVAANPSVPIEMLDRLSSDPSSGVRSAVAANPSVPIEMLDRLSSDPSPEVLSKVVSNPKCRADVLTALITQSDSIETDGIYDGEIMRMEAAGNPSLPMELIVSLSKDPSASVRSTLAANISAPVELLESFLEDNGDPVDYDEVSIRSGVASNPSCPISLLSQLAKDKNAEVRAQVAQNKNSPLEILESLATDPDENVSHWISRRSESSNLGLDKIAYRSMFGPVLTSKP